VTALSYVRKKLTAIRLKPEQIARLEKIAAREDVPVSWLIRKAIDDWEALGNTEAAVAIDLIRADHLEQLCEVSFAKMLSAPKTHRVALTNV